MSSSPETRSKKRLIPEGGIFLTASAINFEESQSNTPVKNYISRM
jgi:hypothetical protein